MSLQLIHYFLILIYNYEYEQLFLILDDLMGYLHVIYIEYIYLLFVLLLMNSKQDQFGEDVEHV